MDIQLNQLIIHELSKEADSGEVQLFLTDRIMPLNENTGQLVHKLNDTFIGKNDLLHGYLSSPEDALFPGYFQSLVDDQLSEEAFMDFTRNTMNALQLSLQGVIGAKGGYIVYADYKYFNARMLGIFLIRDTDGLVFSRMEDENAFNLDPITHLDISKMAMAARITIDNFQKEEGRYLDLIKHSKSQKEISEYFINWVGLEQPETSKELTQTFMAVVDQLPLPVNEETGNPIEEKQFRDKVLKFASQSPQKIVELEKFDQHFYGDEPTTQKFLQEHDIEMDKTFRVDQSTMKSFYNYRVNAEGVSVNFKRDHMRKGLIRTEGDTLIIHSPQLVEQFMDYLEDREED